MTESSKEGLLEELLEIQRTHQRLFAAAMGYIELDLTMEQRNEIVDRMIEEEVGEIPDLLARVRSNSDLDPYWTGHVLCFFGYVLGRAGKDDQAAIHLREAVDIFSDYEKSHPYPDGFPLEEIKKYGADNSYFSQHAHGLRVVMLPEDEKEQAHIENIERVKSNFPDNKYWIAETYRMAGENIAFREEAVDYFRQGLGYIESLSDIDDLKNNEEDGRFHTWLKLKVEYIEHLDMYKKTDAESEEVLKGREEIEPYKHLITWRQEVSRGDVDNESDDSDDVDDEEKEVIQYSDGSSYTGVVTDGLANGWGTRWYADDRRVVGNFDNDKPHTAVEFDGDAEVIAVYVEFNRTEGTAESHIESGNWTAEEFHQAISEDRSLEGIDLQGLDLQGRKFVSRVMNQSNLSRARLDNAKFKHAYLIDANLTAASLVGSDFSNATGASAVMKDANLSGARFVDAKFSDADFSHANLKGADLSWAMLDMANLTGADLTGADISHTNLLGATYDGTTMPDGSVKTEDPSNYEVLEKELENSNWMYEGEAQDDEPHGEGTIYIKDESRDGYLITYYGQFENGIMNGEGHLVLPNGLKLFGEFVEDKLPMGTLINDIEGFTYTGELQGYAPHGQGTSVIHDGTRFVGEFSEGQPKKGTVYDAEGNETEKLRPGIGGTLGRLFKKD